MATEKPTEEETPTSAPASRKPKPLWTFVKENPELCIGIAALIVYVFYNAYQIATGTGRWKILNKKSEL